MRLHLIGVVCLLGLAACVTPPPPITTEVVSYGSGSGAVLADAVAILGASDSGSIAQAEWNWLAANYPGWTLGEKTPGVDGDLAYHAVVIRRGASTRTVYFDISQYYWT